MKTIKKIPIEYEFFEGERPYYDDMEQNIIYVSKETSQAFHVCLCGCKNPVVMALDSIDVNGEITEGKWPGKNWNLSIKGEKATFSPSIGNYSYKCQSHYIITNSIANFV